ncbi:hypothetical protein C8A05DRAFT_37421 [Staphylotrichum tortipilum]|uniref:Uncharacterized protein n=1 Tax=Staphylotrichum tortipilum TaxID=2831512 RepID=A0AAN6RQZ9_9PEZI|nr:hypothetical protein C8A05DRAFT_37421 [Staphylotrichum longicolle]
MANQTITEPLHRIPPPPYTSHSDPNDAHLPLPAPPTSPLPSLLTLTTALLAALATSRALITTHELHAAQQVEHRPPRLAEIAAFFDPLCHAVQRAGLRLLEFEQRRRGGERRERLRRVRWLDDEGEEEAEEIWEGWQGVVRGYGEVVKHEKVVVAAWGEDGWEEYLEALRAFERGVRVFDVNLGVAERRKKERRGRDAI